MKRRQGQGVKEDKEDTDKDMEDEKGRRLGTRKTMRWKKAMVTMTRHDGHWTPMTR